MNTDNRLLTKQISRGDENAFKVLYEEFFHALLAVACKYVETETAEDIVQDTFFKLWNAPQKFVQITDLCFYLYRSVQNQCLNYIRDRKGRKLSERNNWFEDFFITCCRRKSCSSVCEGLLMSFQRNTRR
ncbi:MAG: RNA polymerase sigma factor [Butyricimonas faecalis]